MITRITVWQSCTTLQQINRELKFFVELLAGYLHDVEEFKAKIAASMVSEHAAYESALKVHEILLIKVGHKIAELKGSRAKE